MDNSSMMIFGGMWLGLLLGIPIGMQIQIALMRYFARKREIPPSLEGFGLAFKEKKRG